jgi:D-alanyl-D-alanine carboxypeptidase (penicillin-binding protein 5/6)
MERRFFMVMLLLLLVIFGSCMYLFTFTPLNHQILGTLGMLPPTYTPTPSPTPSPTPTLTPTLPPTPTPTPKGMLPQVQASALYLMDLTNGRVLANVGGNQVLPMASTAKIMTAIIALENGNQLQRIPIGQDAFDRVHVDGASSAGLDVGDAIPLQDLMYGLLLPSGADAATAIADYIGGSTSGFVQIMNTYAQRLHLWHTHFVDVDGLSSGTGTLSTTTAADLTTLARYAMNNPTFAQIVKQQYYHVPPTLYHHAYDWTSTNGLLSTYSGMIGVKTGHSDAAEYCMAFAAIRNQQYLIGSILNSPSEEQRNQDITAVLDWGFDKVGAGH